MPSEGSGLRCGSIHNRSFVRLEEQRSGAVALERPRDVARSVSVCLGWSFPDCQGGRCLYPQRLRKRQQAGALQTLRELEGAAGGRGGLPPLCRFVIRAELDPGHPTTELDGRLPRRLAVLDLRFGGRRFPSPPAFGATSSTRFWVCPWPTRTACARSSVRGRALLSGGFSRPPQLGAQSPCPKPLTRPGCGPGAGPARPALRGCPRRPAR